MTISKTLMWGSGAAGAGNLPINGVPATLNANGASDPVNISAITTLMASVFVGTPTGSTPQINFYIDVQDSIGTWLQVLALTQITASAYTYAAVGPGSATTYVLTNKARFRWVVSAGSSWPNVQVALAGH